MKLYYLGETVGGWAVYRKGSDRAVCNVTEVNNGNMDDRRDNAQAKRVAMKIARLLEKDDKQKGGAR